MYATNIYGYFGPVCDDGWGTNEANVVCRYIYINILYVTLMYIREALKKKTFIFSDIVQISPDPSPPRPIVTK